MAKDTSDGQDENGTRTTRTSDTGSEATARKDGRIERRSFLHLAGAASVAGASVLSTGTADAAEERHGITFQRVLNAVDDLGMDDTGQQAIDSALSSAAGDGTLIVFPQGTYRVNQQLTLKNVSNFGIVGASSDRSDVQFVTNSGNALQWIVAVDGRNHLYENFTMQQTRDEKTSFTCVWKLPTGLHVENVDLAGWNPRDDVYDTKPGLRPQITSRDGVGVLKNFACTGGGVVDTYPARRVPIWMGPAHRGELRVVDCHVEESGSHAIYASRTNGCIRVEGGLFKNNDNTNMRIASGHPSKLSWIRGAEIVVDTDNAKHLPDGERYQQTRGIRCESGFQGWSGLLVEDCDIIFKSTPNSAGLIAVHRTHGAVTVRNTRLRNEVDGVPFINAKQPNYSDVDAPYDLTLENVSITGAAANTHAAVRVDGRNGSVVEKSCIERENSAGVKILDSENCAVRDTNINVPGEATIFQDSSVSTSNITHGDTCPLPSFDGVEGNVDGDPVLDTGSETDLDHLLDVTGGGPDDVVEYSFEVDGELEGVALNSEDSVSGTTGAGAVAGGTDTYGFSGSITAFSSTGDLTVSVDGQAVDTSQWDVGADGPDRVVTIDGHGDRADYEFSVSGALEKSTDGGASINDDDAVDGSTATGAVWGGSDSYRFDGEISAFALDGDATVSVDGEQVDPSRWDSSDDSTSLDRTVQVVGTGVVTNYEFTVSGDLVGADGSIEPWDDVSGSTANAYVTETSDVDTFSFDGEITDFRFHEGEATVYVDGSEVDPASLGGSSDGGSDDLPHTLEVTGGGPGNVVEYAITVDGEMAGVELNSEDTVSGSTAEGAVAGGTDTYAFSGSITDVSTGGDVTVTVDGEAIDLGRWALPNTVVVDGTGDADATEYSLAVTGDLAVDESAGPLEDGDVIEGGSARGSVSDEVDAFRFSGDLTELLLQGNAAVDFEDNDG